MDSLSYIFEDRHVHVHLNEIISKERFYSYILNTL